MFKDLITYSECKADQTHELDNVSLLDHAVHDPVHQQM